MPCIYFQNLINCERLMDLFLLAEGFESVECAWFAAGNVFDAVIKMMDLHERVSAAVIPALLMHASE